MMKSNKMNKKPLRASGFTLIELLISLFIISVISAVAMPHLRGSGERAQKTSCEANQRLIRAVLEDYYLEHGHYPSGSSAEILTELKNKHYLQSIPTEPAGGTYEITTSDDGSSVTVKCSVHGELGD
ncbi:competence type IV pilus major pilin ComGC [Collibacillus ludicampi]|nr:prepilin-type N-terminal cleavage/methylation domain-containing protein [Collibacillus ludicampi]